MRAASRADHDGGWRGQTQAARAGDNQHSHENLQRKAQTLPGPQPTHRSHHTYGQYGRHKIPSYDIGQAGNRRFARLCSLD